MRRFLVLRLLVGFAALGGFLLIGQHVNADNALTAFDHSISTDMVELRRHLPFLAVPFFALTLLAALQTMFVLVPLSGLLLWTCKQRNAAILVILCGIAAGTSNFLLKHHYQRTRPDAELRYRRVWENNESFPSGHSSSSMAIFGFLGYLSWRRARTPNQRFWGVVGFGLLIFGIGFSRIVLCAHYVSDVIGGYLLGLSWLMVFISAASFLGERSDNNPQHTSG